MKHILIFTILSILFMSFSSFIHPIECSLFKTFSSEYDEISSYGPSPSPSLSPDGQPSPSLAKSYEDVYYPFSPDGAPFSMQDADGDPIDLPTDASNLFNPFSSEEKNEEQKIQYTTFDPSVKSTCEKTDNPELCLTSLRPFLSHNAEVKQDAPSLLEIEIRATLQATQLALTLANKDLATPNKEKPDVAAFKDCKENYVDAARNLQQALDACVAKDLGTTTSMLSAAISDFATCDDGFQESDKNSPMSGYGARLYDMVSNCLAMASTVTGRGNEDE